MLSDGYTDETRPAIISDGEPSYGPLCDIGLNLLDSMFFGEYNGKQRHAEDLDYVLRRAAAVGVTRHIITAGNTEESTKALRYASQTPPPTRDISGDENSESQSGVCSGLFTTVGVHPTRCSEFSQKGVDAVMAHLDRLLTEGSGRVVAVGECGLDYDRLHFCSKEQQRIGFLKQFELAERHQLPMFFHDRNTEGDFLSIVREQRELRGEEAVRGVVHSFTGSVEEMEAYVNLGLYIGINGCSLKTTDGLEVAKQVPLNRLLLETDAPWCSIKNTHASKRMVKTEFMSKKKERYERGWLVKDRGEPCLMVQIVEVMACLKEMDPSELAATVMNNTKALFFPREVNTK